jgi:serine/threonine protein kinase
LRHPNIVRVFDFDVQDAYVYMVMELIDGMTLESRKSLFSYQSQAFPM